MRHLLSIAVLVATLLSAAPAGASWPLSGASEVHLGYGQPWSGGDAVHRGVDLACEPGDAVQAPEHATVGFAGRIPSGAGSGTVLAVSLDLPDGYRLSLSPLESVMVEAGDAVGAGEEIGALAASGDASHPSSHLHVSLRRNGAYLDPMTRLVVPVPPTPGPSESPQPDEARPAPSQQLAPARSAPSAPAASPAGRARGITPSHEAFNVAAEDAAASASPHPAPSTAPLPKPGVQGVMRSASIAGRRAVARELSAGTRAYAAPREPAAPEAGQLGATLLRAARGLARGASGVLVVVLAGIGLLWPLWRRDTSARAQSVRPAGDDVAAAVGRW